MTILQIVFDQAGGATLQTRDYCHRYTDMDELAEAMASLDGRQPFEVQEAGTKGWDGNEPENRIVTDTDEFWAAYDRGEYKMYDGGDPEEDDGEACWDHVRRFAVAYWGEETEMDAIDPDGVRRPA